MVVSEIPQSSFPIAGINTRQRIRNEFTDSFQGFFPGILSRDSFQGFLMELKRVERKLNWIDGDAGCLAKRATASTASPVAANLHTRKVNGSQQTNG